MGGDVPESVDTILRNAILVMWTLLVLAAVMILVLIGLSVAVFIRGYAPARPRNKYTIGLERDNKIVEARHGILLAQRDSAVEELEESKNELMETNRKLESEKNLHKATDTARENAETEIKDKNAEIYKKDQEIKRLKKLVEKRDNRILGLQRRIKDLENIE